MKNKRSHPEKKAIWWKESWPHSSSSTTSNKGLLTAKGYQQYRVWGYHENAFSQTISYLSFFPLHSPGFGICHNMEERTVVRELVVGSLPIYMCLGWRKEAKPIALRLATSGGRWESTHITWEDRSWNRCWRFTPWCLGHYRRSSGAYEYYELISVGVMSYVYVVVSFSPNISPMYIALYK